MFQLIMNAPDLMKCVPKNKKPIRNKRDKGWLVEKTFPDAPTARNSMISEKTWSLHNKQVTENWTKYYYRCSKGKSNGPEKCQREAYLLFSSDSKRVTLFKTTSDHTHSQIISNKNQISNNKITPEMKEKIEKFYKMKLKPKAILAHINELFKSNIAMYNLRNVLTRIKKKSVLNSITNHW